MSKSMRLAAGRGTLRDMRVRVLLLLPALCALGIALALFVVGAPRPFMAARVLGGPTEGMTQLAWRVELRENFRQVTAPAIGQPLRVVARLADGRRASWQGRTNELGLADAKLVVAGAPIRGPVGVAVTLPKAETETETVADGPVQLSVNAWRSLARRRGGLDDIGAQGDLRIAVAPARGVFATGYATGLVARVLQQGRPVVGASVQAEFDGATPTRADGLTDPEGKVVLEIRPDAFNLSATLNVTSGAATGRWHAVMPVVAGAILAKRKQGDEIVVRSAIGRERAFYSIVDREGRHAGGTLRLRKTGSGASVAKLTIQRQPPFWMVLSSEPRLDTQSTVGWPFPKADKTVAKTFDVPEVLLLDGTEVQRQAEQRRVLRVRWGAAVLCGLAVVVLGVVWWRESRPGPELPGLRQASRGRPWLALAMVVLGFLLLALLVLASTSFGF